MNRFWRCQSTRRLAAWWLVASNPFLGELETALSRPVSDRLQWVHEAEASGIQSLRDFAAQLKTYSLRPALA